MLLVFFALFWKLNFFYLTEWDQPQVSLNIDFYNNTKTLRVSMDKKEVSIIFVLVYI